MNAKILPGQAGRLDPVCDGFEDIWLAGGCPRLEDFLPQAEHCVGMRQELMEF